MRNKTRKPHMFEAVLRFPTEEDAECYATFVEEWHGADVSPPYLRSHRLVTWSTGGDGVVTLMVRSLTVTRDSRNVGDLLSRSHHDWCDMVMKREVPIELVGITRATPPVALNGRAIIARPLASEPGSWETYEGEPVEPVTTDA